MQDKAEFRNSILCTISFAAALALLVLLVVVATRAQNPVPPAAREAAASSTFAAKLHPATPPATNKPRASTRLRTGRASPQDGVIYENGPINGTTNAWTINFGYIVSDTFVPNGTTVGGFDIYVWEELGDSVTSLQWSITSGPNSGTVYGSGTVSDGNLTDTFISSNQYNYDIDEISASGLNVAVTFGNTYWVNLQNAVSEQGQPVYWDENSGVGCHSPGCPSQAYQSGTGTIPSEAFDITGGGLPPPSISNFEPRIGPVGKSVIITGENLTGATSVTFGGVEATSFTVVSDTQIRATVPAGARRGKIGVTTPQGTATSYATFIVT